MNEREQLIKLIDDKLLDHMTFKNLPEVLADYLIENGFRLVGNTHPQVPNDYSFEVGV